MIRLLRHSLVAFVLVTASAMVPPSAMAQDPASVCGGVTARWNKAVTSGSVLLIAAAREAARPLSKPCPALQRRIASYDAELKSKSAREREREVARQREVARLAAERERERAAERAAKMRCDMQWQTAKQEATMDGFLKFVVSCGNHPEVPTANGQLAAIRKNPLAFPGLPASGTPIPKQGLSAENLQQAGLCEGGNAQACSYLGAQFLDGTGAPNDAIWGVALVARACSANLSQACSHLGFSLAQGGGVRRDYARAIIFDQRGCETGSFIACTNWGSKFYSGLGGVAINYQTAVSLFERGCNSGNSGGYPNACRYAANIYENGLGPVPEDRTKAFALVEAGLRLEPTNAELIALRARLAPVSNAQSTLPPCIRGPYNVYFDWSRSDITPEAAMTLDNLVLADRNCQGLNISLIGHTDKSGEAEYNLNLSMRMTSSVKAYLVGRGISSMRILEQGFGESKPLVLTADGVREPRNRRVEISWR